MRLSGVAGCAAGESTDMRAATESYQMDSCRFQVLGFRFFVFRYRFRVRVFGSLQSEPSNGLSSTIELNDWWNGFHRTNNALDCASVPRRARCRGGTPLYVYSAGTIARRYRAMDEAFRRIRTRCITR